MYEKRFKSSRFGESVGKRSAFVRLGYWLVVALVGYFALFSCCELRYSIRYYEADANVSAYPDSCTVVVWKRVFPRKVTRFVVKPNIEP